MLCRVFLTISIIALAGFPVRAETIVDTEFAKACLVAEDETLENSTLNWQKIRFLEELDYCLIAVAQHLSSPNKLISWMKASGFHVSDPIAYSRKIMWASYKYDGEGVLINGRIPKREFKWSIHPLRTFGAYSLHSGILLRNNGHPEMVTSVLNTK